MASQIAAVASLRPRVLRKSTLNLDIIALRLARGGLASRSIVRMVLDDLVEQIAIALREGDAVHLEGLGRFGLDIRMDGRLRPSMRFDPQLRHAVHSLDVFEGTITNRENLGLSTAEIVEKWNELHPDNPVER